MPPESEHGSPIFVGGTGRSGTTIAGELLGARADVALVPCELRFHVDSAGLPDLAAGEITVDRFARRLRRVWWERPSSRNGPRGLGVIATRPQMRQAIGRLRERHPEDPWGACGAFMDEMIRPFARTAGATTWAEMSPPNACRMDSLCRMFPNARIVHMVRDGRDVASSVTRRHWGPNDIESALAWWADQLIRIHEANERVDAARVITMRVESLVGPRRESEYNRLLDFLGRQPDPGMRAFFDDRITVGRSHPERWRMGLEPAEQERIVKLYDEQLARLAEHRVTIPPIA
jgi:hypothetical protein